MCCLPVFACMQTHVGGSPGARNTRGPRSLTCSWGAKLFRCNWRNVGSLSVKNKLAYRVIAANFLQILVWKIRIHPFKMGDFNTSFVQNLRRCFDVCNHGSSTRQEFMSEQKKHVHAGHVFIWAAGICAKSRSNKNTTQKSGIFLLHVWSWMVFFRWFGESLIRFVPVELAGPLGAWLSPTHGASPMPSPKDQHHGSPKSSLSSPKRRAFLEPDTAQVHILQAPWGVP